MAGINKEITELDDIVFLEAVDSVLEGKDPYGVASQCILELNHESTSKRNNNLLNGSKEGDIRLYRLVSTRFLKNSL
jgi:hypothetical protein